jgi:hypothetical protein
MVKFAKRFFYQVIPEWRDHYIDYRALYRQIKAVKASVLDLAKAYAHIKEITGEEGNKAIQLERMKAEKEFWEMLDANVEKVERWYISQMEHFTEQFHILTLQLWPILENLSPMNRGEGGESERECDGGSGGGGGGGVSSAVTTTTTFHFLSLSLSSFAI